MIRLANPDEKPTLETLLRAYLSEMAKLGVLDDPDAVFNRIHAAIDTFWNEAGHFPYLIMSAGEIAGFALVHHGALSEKPGDFVMAEFYVAPFARRKGAGKSAAFAAFARHPGRWEMWVNKHNAPAAVFWRHVLDMSPITGHGVLDDGDGVIHRFRYAPVTPERST